MHGVAVCHDILQHVLICRDIHPDASQHVEARRHDTQDVFKCPQMSSLRHVMACPKNGKAPRDMETRVRHVAMCHSMSCPDIDVSQNPGTGISHEDIRG